MSIGWHLCIYVHIHVYNQICMDLLCGCEDLVIMANFLRYNVQNEAWEQNWGVDIVLFRLDITVFTWVMPLKHSSVF